MNITKRKKYRYLSFSNLILLLSFLLITNINKNYGYWRHDNKIIVWDVVNYYSYLPATFIYKDIRLQEAYKYKEGEEFLFWPKEIENGNNLIKTSMGASVMYSPFFFLAHEYAKQFNFEANGYSEPYRFALILSSVIYLFIGLITLRKILKIYFSEITAGLVLLAVLAGTNVFWYSTSVPAYPHTQSFMLISLFVLFTIKWHENKNIKYSVII